MRIAQVAPLFESVPPQGYGGTERVVSYLTEALVERGHEVTLFASGDSRTRARLVPVVPRGLRLDPHAPNWQMAHAIGVDRVFRRADDFDVIHCHLDVLQYLLATRCDTPCVTTLHGRLDLPGLRALHEYFAPPLVSISNSQRQPLSNAHWCATVYHGLPRGQYAFQARPRDYFAFIGRISPEKGVDRAIEIAIACGTPLLIAAKVDPADKVYFERAIRPLLGHPLVHFIGEIGEAQKSDFLGGARALLFPVDWPEPFGLVLIEAFACGTPVVAYRRGSVPEVVQDGVTGFIVENQQQAIAAARAVDRLDRRRCREVFERRFTSDVMAGRYLQVYQSLIDTRRPMRPELVLAHPVRGHGDLLGAGGIR